MNFPILTSLQWLDLEFPVCHPFCLFCFTFYASLLMKGKHLSHRLLQNDTNFIPLKLKGLLVKFSPRLSWLWHCMTLLLHCCTSSGQTMDKRNVWPDTSKFRWWFHCSNRFVLFFMLFTNCIVTSWTINFLSMSSMILINYHNFQHLHVHE